MSKVHIAPVLRGQGLRVSTTEEEFYKKHCKNVDIQWQGKAWVDQETMIGVVQKTWKEMCERLKKDPIFAASPEEKNVLFMDNLAAHTSEETIAAFAALNTEVMFGPSTLTQSWRPVDQGFAAIFKKLYSIKLEDWSDEIDPITNVLHFHILESGKMTASERRMVMALCVQKPYEEIVEMLAKDDANQFNMESLRRMFARGGLLVTSDRKTWDEVQPQGFDNFSILPPWCYGNTGRL